jgi:molybdate transport system substrate-binding protein
VTENKALPGLWQSFAAAIALVATVLLARSGVPTTSRRQNPLHYNPENRIETMMRVALAIVCALFTSIALRAAEITVMTSGAFRAALQQLAPQYERATHNKLVVVGGPSMGTTHDAIPMRLERGEVIDVVIIAAPALDDLIRQGKVQKSGRVDLVQSKIAMAVKAGAPRPDISTVDALKRTLLASQSIAYSDSASGVYLSTELFPKLGIADQIKSKSKMIPAIPVGDVIARGEAEIGFQQVSELRMAAGIDIVGELPPGAQQVTIFSAAIPATAKQPAAGKKFIQWLALPARYPVIRKTGLEPAKSK